MQDNLEDLLTKFTLDLNEKYASGSMWKCLKCGALAHSEEQWFPCQTDFVPVRVFCNECHSRWRLNLEPTSEELEKVAKHMH